MAIPTEAVENKLERTWQALSLTSQMRDACSKAGPLTAGSSAHTPPRLGPANANYQMFGWEGKSIFLQNLLHTALVLSSEGIFQAAPAPAQPWKHKVRAQAEPGEAPAVLETPKQQQQQPGSTTCVLQKKPLFTTIPNIINQPTVCSDRKLLLTTLILLNKWNHPITHSNLINRSTQRRKWALQNGLEKSSHFVLPFN